MFYIYIGLGIYHVQHTHVPSLFMMSVFVVLGYGAVGAIVVLVVRE